MTATLTAVMVLLLFIGVDGFARAFVANAAGSSRTPSGPEGDVLKGPIADTFKALDADGSGFVEREEIKAFAEAQGITGDSALADLGDIDTDGDGRLSVAELAGTLGSPAVAPAIDGLLDATVDETAYDAAMATALTSAAAYDAAMATALTSAAESTDLSADLVTSSAAADTAVTGAGVATTASADLANAQPAETTVDWFTNVSQTAQQVALHDAAALFVSGVAQALEEREKHAAEAQELEAKALELRANASEIVREGPALVEAAARMAVEKALRKPMTDVQKLDALAARTEQEAVQTREKARQLRAKALAEQDDVLASVRQLRGDPST